MATLILILTLLVLLPTVTRIYLLNPKSPLHRSVVMTGGILILIGILEYEIAHTTSVQVIRNYALWHSSFSILLLYSGSSIAYYFAAPYSELWKKIGLIIGMILFVPVIFIIYNLFFNHAILDTNHEIINGEWQYSINQEGLMVKVFKIWILIVAIYLALSHFIGYYFAKGKVEKALKLLLVITFVIIPFFVAYEFIFSINGENKGTYNLTPYLSIILIVISWIYTNFKLFEINPAAAIDNILEAMSNIIIITDLDFKTKYTNDMVTPFGIDKKDFLNKSLLDFAHEIEHIPTEVFERLTKLKKDEKIIETFTLKFDNKEYYLLTTISAIYNQQNLKIGYVFVFINITETIQNQNQLKDYALQLEQSNKELERFAYIASHDMKAPLRNIISFLGLIERKLKKHEDNDIHEFIHFASSNARYMHNLVQDILAFSQISKINKKLEPVDLNEIIFDLQKELSTYILERNATINFEKLPVINASRAHIYQLFQNIIENGIKYNESPVPMVNITVTKENKRLKIAFEDNGIGISAAFHEQIFEMFKRLHNNTIYQGTGIGLAICKKIMEIHQGDIQVLSNENEGSTFILDFPLVPTTSVVR
jgi:PAS domain S-box-containing protein